MAKYVERDAFIANIRKEAEGLKTEVAIDIVIEGGANEAKAFPSADVKPVRHGRWHSRFLYREYTKAYDCEMHVCSECGSEWSYDAETGLSDFNYCPTCGAKMDGV